jgi:putative Mg2+ transporter-C (MgtC) family protein
MLSEAERDVLLRVLLAGVLGYVVGWEREYVAHREAGTRTFSLVAMSSALVTALSIDIFGIDSAARVIANIVVGVGFLGGGTILKDVGHIHGLTTAAGMWAIAAVGIAVGSGRVGLGIVAAGMVLIVFSADRVEDLGRRLLRRPPPPDRTGGEEIDRL